jgi:hypothetical protein
MSAKPSRRPDPVQTRIKRHPSGLVDIKLRMRDIDAANCQRCSRCMSKTKYVEDGSDHVECGHRLKARDVNAFLFGPMPTEPVHRDVPERNVPEDIPEDSDRVGFPVEASMTTVDFFGAKGMLFAWSDAAWAIEPNKPDAWPIRDGRLLIVPASNWEVSPWAGRSERFGVAKSLDVEVSVNGIVAVYNVAPPIDEDATPSPRSAHLTGPGGIPWVDIVCRRQSLPTP